MSHRSIILAVLLTPCFGSIDSRVSAQHIFVSPLGSDSGTGTNINDPLRTFQAAADRARSIGSGAVVEFADGQYVFDQTAVLDASHSGISFRAAPGATPVFTSLQQVTGWTPHSGNILVADLPTGINHVRYLQDASENWMERSAGPRFSTTEAAGGDDGGCIECNNYTQSTQPDMSNILYSGPAVDWSKASQYDLRASTLPWHQEILPVASYDSGQNRIHTAVPGLYDLRADVQERPPQAWVMNTLEGIDSPGEWASLDGKVYLHPKSGTGDIFVPRLTELIRIDDGTVDGNATVSMPVSNITFDGLTFTGGDFRTMQSDDITAQHDWAVVDEPDALLRIRNAQNITVRNSTFTKSGGSGIRVDRHGQNVVVTNNNLSHLGRGGITFTGRGPGYGDVNRDNEISYNHLEAIGLEKWASVAILLDQSSNNHVHHNYIQDTFFTGIALVGPRQLAIAALLEGADDFYGGREFHFFEWAPEVVEFANDFDEPITDGSREAMQFVYNYNNLVEENALIDVATGQDMYLNGQIYVSGAQRSPSAGDIKTNDVERNYLYDSFNHSSNDYAFYSDSDQDAASYIGNMILGVLNGDEQPEAAPIILAFNQWAESTEAADMGLGLGQIVLRANVTEASTFCSGEGCEHTIGVDFVEEGQVINGVGGDVAFLSVYQQMYASIFDSNFPQVATLPGAQTMRDRLAAVITQLGGIVPIPGDYDGNGVVDDGDLNLVLLHWNTAGADLPGTWFIERPFGVVGVDQLNHVLFNWGNKSGTGAGRAAGTVAVPETSSVVMFGSIVIGLFAWGARMRRSLLDFRTSCSRRTGRRCEPLESRLALSASAPFELNGLLTASEDAIALTRDISPAAEGSGTTEITDSDLIVHGTQVGAVTNISVTSQPATDVAGHTANDITVDFVPQLGALQLLIELTSGQIYQDGAGGNVPPSQALIGSTPSVQWDTFVSLGGFTSETSDAVPGFAGGATTLGGPGTAQFDTSGINTTWFPPGGTVIGNRSSYPIGRVTLSDDAVGTWRLLVTTAGGNGVIAPDDLAINLGSGTDQFGEGFIASGQLLIGQQASVVGRHVFYDGSVFDEPPGGQGSAASPQDDLAIDSSKEALLPGVPAEFKHYTNYIRGINGIMVDIQNFSGNTSAFQFRVGNTSDPSGWTDASGSVKETATRDLGDGITRVTFIFETRVDPFVGSIGIENQWLQVRTTTAAGIPADDVFYFGNQIGEVGNVPGNTRVNSDDTVATNDNTTGFSNPLGVTNRYDVNKDNRVASNDVTLVADNGTGFAATLGLFTFASGSGSGSALVGVYLSTALADSSHPIPDEQQLTTDVNVVRRDDHLLLITLSDATDGIATDLAFRSFGEDDIVTEGEPRNDMVPVLTVGSR